MTDLEARVQLGEVRVLACESEHALLNHRALHIIIFDYHVLLQNLFERKLYAKSLVFKQ